MMQTTDTRESDYFSLLRWLWLNITATRRILFKVVMAAVIVIIIYIISQKPQEVSLAEYNNMIKQFPAAISHPALRYAVLPGTVVRSL